MQIQGLSDAYISTPLSFDFKFDIYLAEIEMLTSIRQKTTDTVSKRFALPYTDSKPTICFYQ
jgi:hypothetical protein